MSSEGQGAANKNSQARLTCLRARVKEQTQARAKGKKVGKLVIDETSVTRTDELLKQLKLWPRSEMSASLAKRLAVTPPWLAELGAELAAVKKTLVWVTPEELLTTEVYLGTEAEDNRPSWQKLGDAEDFDCDTKDGYQRDLIPSKIYEIIGYALADFPFPALLLARLAGTKRMFYIDGHHRGLGLAWAGRSVPAVVVECDIDKLGRLLFIVHNSKATKVKQTHVLRISRNESARQVRSTMARYGMTHTQALRIFCGVLAGRAVHGVDLVNLRAKIDSRAVRLVHQILDVWTDSKMWLPMRASKPKPITLPPENYSSVAAMQLVGALANATLNGDAPGLLMSRIHRLKNANWNSDSQLGRVLGSGMNNTTEAVNLFISTPVAKFAQRPRDHTRDDWANALKRRDQQVAEDRRAARAKRNKRARVKRDVQPGAIKRAS